MWIPPPFPVEIWAMITKDVKTRPWTEDDFNPPPFDLKAFEGLKQTSPMFRSLVQLIAAERQDIETFNPKHLEKVELGRIKCVVSRNLLLHID